MAVIGTLMKTELVTAAADETVAHAAYAMARNGVGAVLVLEKLSPAIVQVDGSSHECPPMVMRRLPWASTRNVSVGPTMVVASRSSTMAGP